jgi:predicted TIM-barrel fold metal-dependent hydrolase
MTNPSSTSQTAGRSARAVRRLSLLALAFTAACDGDPSTSNASGASVDVHLHLASQVLTDLYTGGGVPAPTADDLVARLDEGKVKKGIVLAAGYMPFPDDSNMAPENDYVAVEVGKHPDRLTGFCGINPLYGSAPDEVSRCLKLPGMVGVKLHLAGSGIDLTDVEQLAALSAVFDRVQENNAPVLMHVGNEWESAIEAEAFANLSGVIGAHPDVRVAHAHCAGNVDDATIEQWLRIPGAGYNENSFVETSACLKFYKDAPAATRELIVWRFRKWGIERVLLGSDYLKLEPEETPGEAIETLRQYPFTQAELDTILSNDGSRWLGQVTVEQ